MSLTPQERFPHFPFPEILDDDPNLRLMRDKTDPDIPVDGRFETRDFPENEERVPFQGDLAGAMAKLFALNPALILEVYERSCGKDGAHSGDMDVCHALPEAMRRLMATEAKPCNPLCEQIRRKRREHVLRVLHESRVKRFSRDGRGRITVAEGPNYYVRLMQHARTCPIANRIAETLIRTSVVH
jgi:hypothetical protein